MQTTKTPLHRPLRLVLQRTRSSHQSAVSIGAAVGLLVFLFVGMLPSLLLGGSAGAQLARGLLGVQAGPSYGLNALMILGVLSAATIGAAFFAVLGAAAGAAISALATTQPAFKVAP